MEKLATSPDQLHANYGVDDALRDVADNLDQNFIADLQAARDVMLDTEQHEYKFQYNRLRALMYGGKSAEGNLRASGDAVKDTEKLRELAARRANDSADEVLTIELEETLMDRLGYEKDEETEEYNRLMRASKTLASVDDDEWYGENGNDGLLARMQSLNIPVASVNKSPDENTEPFEKQQFLGNELLDEVRSDVDGVRQQYSKLLAERSKKILEGVQSKEAISLRQAELSDLLSALATEMMLDLERLGATEPEITHEIDKFIANETDKVVSDMEAARAHEFEKRGRFTQFLLNKWAEWGNKDGDKLFTKGRFKKAALLALPSAGVGVVLGAVAAPVLALTGAAAVVGAGAALVTRTVARRLAATKLDSVANAQTVAGVQAKEIREQMGDLKEGNLFNLLDVIEERATYYRHRNRNRLIGGMAISMTAGLLSSAAVEALDHYDVGSKLYRGVEEVAQRVRSWWGDQVVGVDNTSPTPTETPVPTPTETPTHPETPSEKPTPDDTEKPTEKPSDNPTEKPDHNGKDSSPSKSDIAEYVQDHKAAGRIVDGEGWYQTFKELGVPASKRDDLLEAIGPNLVKEGIAYRDPSIGGYGINMTESGKMPKDVLHMIAEYADKKGYITISR